MVSKLSEDGRCICNSTHLVLFQAQRIFNGSSAEISSFYSGVDGKTVSREGLLPVEFSLKIQQSRRRLSSPRESVS